MRSDKSDKKHKAIFGYFMLVSCAGSRYDACVVSNRGRFWQIMGCLNTAECQPQRETPTTICQDNLEGGIDEQTTISSGPSSAYRNNGSGWVYLRRTSYRHCWPLAFSRQVVPGNAAALVVVA
jgi:hypothetical protein